MKPGPLVVAAALAAFLFFRRRRLEPTLLIGGVIVVIGCLVYGSGLVQLPNFKRIVEDAGNTLGNWTYLVVGVMAFFETGAFVGLIAPGETFLIFGGVVAGQGTISLVVLIAITWFCAVLGDLASFYAGRRLGRQFLVKHGPKVQITEERIHQVEGFFDRHGGKAIFLGRFVGFIRAVNPFLAGSSGMPFRRFLPYDILGAGTWATMLLVVGYIFWQSFDQVLHYAEQGTLALATVICVVVAVVWAYRHFRVEENRERAARWIDRQLDRPVLRPLGKYVIYPVARWLKGPLVFFWHRITPGDLGLELTTQLTVAAVGSFAFAASAIQLRDHDLLTGDRTAFRWADDVRADWLDHVAKVITAFGTITVTGAAVLVTVVVLLTRERRRVIESVTLVSGLAITWVAVHVAKAAVDRPRPPHPLVDTAGQSFPSAHAAYAFAWVAIAVVLTRTLPGLAKTTATITAALILAVAIGLSRIYLRAHYFSDVVGGWGMGATVFALCGMVGLVVAFLRHNGSRT